MKKKITKAAAQCRKIKKYSSERVVNCNWRPNYVFTFCASEEEIILAQVTKM